MARKSTELRDIAEVSDVSAFELGRQEILAECRENFEAFFSFVMVDPENPGQRMRCSPHQLVAYEFCEAHKNGVLRWPTDTGKTLFTVAYALFRLGRDASLVMLLAGKAEEVAQKPHGILRSYLENPDLNVRVRQVFPHLVPSDEPGQAWTDSELTIKRPPGGADPSVRAVGLDSDFQGKKTKLYLADDLLDDENTGTEYQRKKLFKLFFSKLNSRLVPSDESKGFLINVPWDRDDLTFQLERKKDEGGREWATLAMDIHGNVKVTNTDWTTPLLRKSRFKKDTYRLAAHDPDARERVPLMPQRWSVDWIAEAKATEPPGEFARSREISPRAPEEARCQRIWIDGGYDDEEDRDYPGCLVRGTHPAERIDRSKFGKMPVYSGMDVSTGESTDSSAIVSIGVRDDSLRVLLNVESGWWLGPEQAERGIDFIERYDGDLTVESNGYQKTLKQWIVALRPDLLHRVHALNTDDKKKDSKQFGIEAIFGEFYRGEWLIPADADGRLEPEIEALVQECVDWRPGQHPGNRLMALFVARAKAHGRIIAMMKNRTPRKPRSVEEGLQDLAKLNPTRWRGKGQSSASLSMRRSTGGF